MNITESFKNKTLVITGGTGSFAFARLYILAPQDI